MAVEHQVWFKFNPGVTPERIAFHMANLAALKSKVPGVIDLKLGKNFTERAPAGVTHGLAVTVASREALKTYLEHPDHVAAAKPIRADGEVFAVDFEF